MKTAVLVIAHGSRVKAANEDLHSIVRWLRAAGRWDVVEPCYLQFGEPDLAQAVEEAIHQGARRLVLVPFLLFPGNHTKRDIPEEVDNLRKKYPQVEILLTRHLGKGGGDFGERDRGACPEPERVRACKGVASG